MHIIKRFSLVALGIMLTLCTACSQSGANGRNNSEDDSGAGSLSEADSSLTGEYSGLNEDRLNPTVSYLTVDVETLKENMPRIEGSIMTIPITEGINERILGMDHATATKTAVHSGNLLAYEKLASGEADIIFVTRPSKEEKETAATLELDYIPIARDGLVFIVNSSNELSDISLQSLKDIYSGKTGFWKSLTKSEDKITAYQHPSNSYMQTLLLDLVMEDLAPMIPPMRKVSTEQQLVADVVASYNNTEDAIGFSSYYYSVGSYGANEQKMLAVDGVFPSPLSIANGSYPLSCDIYAVLPSDTDQSEGAALLLCWLISEQGQEMIIQNGYIPLYALDSEVDS